MSSPSSDQNQSFNNDSDEEISPLVSEVSTVDNERNYLSVAEGSGSIIDQSSIEDTDADNAEETKYTYMNLLATHKNFRIYLISYIISEGGGWLTYVASVELVETILGSARTDSRIYISYILLCRLLPNLVFSTCGGVLADSRDRIDSMIRLNYLSSLTVLFFILAYCTMSMPLVYLAIFLQASIGALFEPCRSAVIPLLVQNEEYLKKATTLVELCWSLMTAFGAGLGGVLVPLIGIQGCFVVDSVSFLCSAALLCTMKGNFNASDDSSSDPSLWKQFESMTSNGMQYATTSSFGPLVLIKATLAVVYGSAAVLNVSFSEEYPDGTEATEGESSARLGLLFFCEGIGCFIGPLIIDPFTNMSNTKTLMRACVFSFVLIGTGWFGLGFVQPLKYKVIFSAIRAAGSSIGWIFSSLLLQILCRADMLGRIVATEFGLAMLTEAASAMLAGILQDNYHLSPNEVSYVMAGSSLFFFVLWLAYFSWNWDTTPTDKRETKSEITVSESNSDSDLTSFEL